MVPQHLLAIIFVGLLFEAVIGAKPSTLELTLDHTGSSGADIYIGEKDVMTITIAIPGGTTTGLMAVFMASLTDTVFAISKYMGGTVGEDITSISNSSWSSEASVTSGYITGPEYGDPNEKIRYNTMLKFDFGDVTNSGSANTAAASNIVIQIEITLVSMATYSSGQSYLPSVTLSNNDDTDILVSRESYSLKGVNSGHNGEESFSLTEMTEIEDGGRIETTNLTMTLTHAAATIDVEAFVLNETKHLAPIKIELVSAGDAYAYGLVPENIIATRYENCSVLDMDRQFIKLDIGRMVNKESQETTPDVATYDVVLRISWLVYDHTALGSTYTCGVGIDINGEEIYVKTFDGIVVARDAAPALTTLTAEAGSTVVTPADAISVQVKMDTPAGSFHTYNVGLVTRRKNAIDSKITILSVTDGGQGDNLPCAATEISPLVLSKTDATNPAVANEGTWQFTVLNHGLMSTNDKNFTVRVLTIADAVKADVYEVVITVNGVEAIAEFTIGDAVPATASFTVAYKTTDVVGAGGSAVASVTLHTTSEKSQVYDMQLKTREQGTTTSKLSIISYAYQTSSGTKPIVTNEPVNLTVTATDPSNEITNNEGSMNVVILNNGGLASDDVAFDVQMVAALDAVVGTVYEFEVDIGGVIKTVDFTIGGSTLTTDYTAVAVDSNMVKAGSTGKAEMTITTTPVSWQEFVVAVSTNQKGASESKLMILSHTIESSGGTEPVISNAPVTLTTSNTDPTNPVVKNQANMALTVFNDGKAPTNDVVFRIEFLAMPDAVDTTVYEFVVDINGVLQTIEFTIAGQVQFNTTVIYNYTMSTPSPATLQPGGEFDVNMTVTTVDDTMPGPMTVELPEPTGTAYVKLVEAKTLSKGTNVACPPSGVLSHTEDSWDPSAIDNAKATVTIPYVCNIKTDNNTAENVWVLGFKFQLISHADLLSIQQVTFGLDVNFSSTIAYEADVTVTSDPMTTTTTTTTIAAPTTAQNNLGSGGSQNQLGSLGGNSGITDEGSTFQFWWIAVAISCSMVLIALITALAVIMKKRKNRNRTSVLVSEICTDEKN